MKFLATICVLSLAGLGLTGPIEQQVQATCATCSQGCLRTDTGECYSNWPESVCSVYTGVSKSLTISILILVSLKWNHSKGGNGVHKAEIRLCEDGTKIARCHICDTQRRPAAVTRGSLGLPKLYVLADVS